MSTPETTEKASWLELPSPGFVVNITNRVRTRVGTLYDGAYLGFYDDPILVPIHDELRPVKLITPEKGQIIALNPGASRISSRIPVEISGKSLALARGKGHEKMDHVQAENEGFIREAPYDEILRYLGFDKETLRLARVYCKSFHDQTPTERQAPFQSAYQVTKEGQKSGLLLVNEKQKTSGSSPFISGGGLFGRRNHATSH